MKIKYLFTISAMVLFWLISLFSLTTISAANTTYFNESNNLRDTIGNASNGDTIVLGITNYNCKLQDYNITIRKNITIKGHISGQSFIDGLDNGYIFNITPGNTLTLDQLVFVNFKGGFIDNYGTLNFINSTLTSSNMGAVNSPNLGFHRFHGLIHNFGNLKIEHSLFTTNHGISDGIDVVIWSNSSNSSINNSVFSQNSGQPIINYGNNFIIENSIFNNNGGLDGIICNSGSNLLISNCSFESNSGTPASVLFISNDTSNCKVINSLFRDNMGIMASYGCIYSFGDNLLVLNSTFLQNLAASGASAIASFRYSSIINCTFVGNAISLNHGTGVGSTIHFIRLAGLISGCVFLSNEGPVIGKSEFSGDPFKIEYSIFMNNNKNGFPTIMIGNNQLSSIDYNFWGTHYSFEEVRKLVNNTNFKNFYYYEFTTTTTTEPNEISIGDNLWYNFGIYLSSTGQRTNVSYLPQGFLVDILQGKVTNLDGLNTSSSDTSYVSGGHHGSSIIPPVSNNPPAYTNLKTINQINLANGGYFASKIVDEYTIFLLRFRTYDLASFVYHAFKPSSSKNSSLNPNYNLFDTRTYGNNNDKGFGDGNGNGFGNGSGLGRFGDGSGLGFAENCGTGTGNGGQDVWGNGYNSAYSAAAEGSSPGFSDGGRSTSGLSGGGSYGDNSIAYQISKNIKDIIEKAPDIAKYIIIVLGFLFLVFFGFYRQKNKSILLR